MVKYVHFPHLEVPSYDFVDESESQYHPAVWQDNMVMVAGEITTQAKLDYEKVPVFLYREMGMGFPSDFCSYHSYLEKIIRIYT